MAYFTLKIQRQPFSGLFSRTTWVSLHQKEMMGSQWHQLGHMQIIFTSLQTDNHASTSSLSSFTGQILFPMLNQQRQSTEGNTPYFKRPQKRKSELPQHDLYNQSSTL